MINAAILIGILAWSASMKDKDPQGYYVISVAFFIALLAVLNFIAGIVIAVVKNGNQKLGIAMILSAFAIAIIGFGACFGMAQ